MKKKYRVTLIGYVEKSIVVEARNKREAEELAINSDENHFSLCNQCTDSQELSDTSADRAEAEEIID